MNCQHIQEQMADVLQGQTDALGQKQVNEHLQGCPDCRHEMEELQSLWSDLGSLPEAEPSPVLRQRFYKELKQHLSEIEPQDCAKQNRKQFRWPQLFWQPAWQLAGFILVLGIGFGGGTLFWAPERGKVMEQNQQVDTMRKDLSLLKLSQPMATDRLAGVRSCAQINQPDADIIDKLLGIVTDDQNIHVRLAAVDALYLFGDQAKVRQGISAALSKQNSPLMQVALIDLLVAWREKQAISSLKALASNGQLDPQVQTRAKEGIAKLL